MILADNDTNKIVFQLRALLQLTNTEIQIAQARTDAVRRELARNADHATTRARLIARTLRDLGGVPDVVSTTRVVSPRW